MRVIAGTARRLVLTTPKGLDTRPTTDRIKETLFNMIQNNLAGVRFLDLFAGSGGIGIEALSRGACYCAFADADRRAINCIKANLEHTHFSDKADVFACDFRRALARLQKSEAFDIIFLDPPYNKGLEIEAVRLIAEEDLLRDNGTIIVECELKYDLSTQLPKGYIIVREKEYKSNKHVFIRKESDAS